MNRPVSWPVIGIAFVLFWPIGLLLLLKRFATDRSAIFSCQSKLRTISIVLFVIGGVLIVSIVGAPFGIWFIIGGFLVRRSARNNGVQCQRYTWYIDLVVNQGQTSIGHIASVVGFPERMLCLTCKR